MSFQRVHLLLRLVVLSCFIITSSFSAKTYSGNLTGYYSYMHARCLTKDYIEGMVVMEYDDYDYNRVYRREFYYEGDCMYYLNGTMDLYAYAEAGGDINIFGYGYCVYCQGMVGCSTDGSCKNFMTKGRNFTAMVKEYKKLQNEHNWKQQWYQQQDYYNQHYVDDYYIVEQEEEEDELGEEGDLEEEEGYYEMQNNYYQMASSSSSSGSNSLNEKLQVMEAPILQLENQVAETVYRQNHPVVHDGPFFYLIGGTIGGVGLLGLVAILELLRQRRVAKEQRQQIQLEVVSQGGYVNTA